jgi:hypothetical protein
MSRRTYGYILAWGRRVYVWGEPFASDWTVMKASGQRPSGRDFRRSDNVTVFINRGINQTRVSNSPVELWVEEGLWVDSALQLSASPPWPLTPRRLKVHGGL